MTSNMNIKQFREKLETDKVAHASFTKDLGELLKKHGVADQSLTKSMDNSNVAIVVTTETGSTKSKSFIITAD